MTPRPSGPLGRRGVTLPLVCVMLTALLGGAALAVDVGRMYLTAGEAQAAADAAALAAARFLQQYGHWNSGAITTSYGIAPVAAANRVAGAASQVQTADVVPAVYNPTTSAITTTSWNDTTSAVQVTVRATPRYVFAGALGLTPPTVRRTAAAWIASVNGATCVRPFALPYTRFYEAGMHGNVQDSTWTKAGGAPDYTYGSVSSLQPIHPHNNRPVWRTYTAIPQWEEENVVMPRNNPGRVVTGRWRPVDFAGGGLTAYQTYLSAAPRSSSCQAASAQVGMDERPILVTTSNGNGNTGNTGQILQAMATGLTQLCNRVGNNADAHCYNSDGTVGVRVRVMLADSLAGGSGTYRVRTREVSMVRIMCYFQTTSDVCAPASITDENSTTSAGSAWQMNESGRFYGYPPGTITVLLDGPTSLDMTSDVVLGAKPGITQRVVLVK